MVFVTCQTVFCTISPNPSRVIKKVSLRNMLPSEQYKWFSEFIRVNFAKYLKMEKIDIKEYVAYFELNKNGIIHCHMLVNIEQSGYDTSIRIMRDVVRLRLRCVNKIEYVKHIDECISYCSKEGGLKVFPQLRFQSISIKVCEAKESTE